MYSTCISESFESCCLSLCVKHKQKGRYESKLKRAVRQMYQVNTVTNTLYTLPIRNNEKIIVVCHFKVQTVSYKIRDKIAVSTIK